MKGKAGFNHLLFGAHSKMTTILIVEDDKEMQELLQLALARRGYEVFLSPNGVDALYQISYHKPDLIILDLMMPWASVHAVLGFIRSTDQLKHTRVLVVSAHPNGEQIAAQLQADSFLAKPVDMPTFTSQVERLLASPEQHPS
jgi:two-component system alkaline phosphatase synthesis response regulator PhoP